jgi:hypothetical protein
MNLTIDSNSEKVLTGWTVILSACFIVWLALQTRFPKQIVVTLPLICVLIVYNIWVLLGGNGNAKALFTSSKGIVALSCFMLFTCLCSISVNSFPLFKNHIPLTGPNPFRNNQWLFISFVGVLFSLSTLNYTLRNPKGFWIKPVEICKIIWRLREPYFLFLIALVFFTTTTLFSLLVFEQIPHIPDEIAQLFQAKIFASGHLAAPLPPLPEFFQHKYDNMIFKNHWYSEYPPGHPFFLMFGVWLRIPWIINPFLASVSLILLYKVALQYYGEKVARLSVILFPISPFALFMSSSFMNHISMLFCMLLFIYTLNLSRNTASSFYAFISSFALGLMLNIRPPDALVIGLVFSVPFIVHSFMKKTYKPFITFVLVIFFMSCVLLLYNYATNGNPLIFGYQVRWGEKHTIGFSHEPIIERPPHTPFRGLVNTLSNLITLNEYLFEWPFPSLMPLLIFWTPFFCTKDRRDYFLLCCLLSIPILYFFYFYQDLWCHGPRFYYTVVPFILILTSKTFFEIVKRISLTRKIPEESVKNSLVFLLFLCLIFSSALRMPGLYAFYSNSFWEVDNKLMKKAQMMGIKNAVIFQKSYSNYPEFSLGAGFLYNSPDLKDSIIFARDLGSRNTELMLFFPGRNYYLSSRNKEGEIVFKPLTK